MWEVLLVGFVLGLHHALDADHVAAVASLVARERSRRRMLSHGASWGLGHALSLSGVIGVALVLGNAMPAHWSPWLEGAVGVMLIGLGAHLVYRLRQEHVHLHVHRHDGSGEHMHFHAHRHGPQSAEANHAARPHDHAHWPKLSFRALLVGMTHGLAGSAALLVLMVAAMKDPWSGIAYVALFSLGSILGMIGLSALLSLPLSLAAGRLAPFYRLGRFVVALTTVFIGCDLVLRLWV